VNETFLNLLATAGGTAITHIGLVNGSGTQVGDARKPVTWTTAADGLIRPTANLVFDMTSGQNVSGWRGYSAATGGTNYGGAALTSTTFSNPGTYTLQASDTAIDVDAA
jgi:2',3'-cyclic-nucleotide 2'-phosphodiesterase (5'-nucleotidase family)